MGVTTGVMMGRTHRVTLVDAAQILGITKEAVRKRVSRGTLPSDVGEDGRRYVYLDDGGDGGSNDSEPQRSYGESDYRDELIEELREEVAAWREEARRKDTIILSLSQRVPELEHAPNSSPEPRESSQTVSEEQERGTGPTDDKAAEKPSWLRRFFGIE
jgi:hypothetical protein